MKGIRSVEPCELRSAGSGAGVLPASCSALPTPALPPGLHLTVAGVQCCLESSEEPLWLSTGL